MTIIVPPEVETSINAAVQNGYFASVDDAMTEAARLLLQQLPHRQASPTLSVEGAKPIWEIIEEENRSIPPEVWDDLPTDLAGQHDHYIYGTPKRSDA